MGSFMDVPLLWNVSTLLFCYEGVFRGILEVVAEMHKFVDWSSGGGRF